MSKNSPTTIGKKNKFSLVREQERANLGHDRDFQCAAYVRIPRCKDSKMMSGIVLIVIRVSKSQQHN